MDERPTEKDFIQFLTTYAPYWKTIATLLGLQKSLIKVIEMNENFKPRECFRDALSKWLSQDVDATWRKLELCITNSQRSDSGFKQLDSSKCQEICNVVMLHVNNYMLMYGCIC